jgi:uncharacterized protein YndB with AHSA1/START domain
LLLGYRNIANIRGNWNFMGINELPFAAAQMMIRKPVEKVFAAFIDPAITKQFWFTRGSGRLDEQEIIVWEWEMYNVSTTVTVKKIVKNEKIVIEWGEPATTVVFNFTNLGVSSTFVDIRNFGFHQTGDELLAEVRDSTGGFTTVLDGLKAYLEHGIQLNLVADKFPKEVVQHGN